MDDTTFQALWATAHGFDNREAYITENEEALAKVIRGKEKREEQLGKMWDVAHMTIRELIEKAGYNQSSFARHFCVPLRTVQDWCRKPEACTPWVKLGFARQLGML